MMRSRDHLFGQRIIERLQSGEAIRYSAQRPKIQNVIRRMMGCELLQVTADFVHIKAKLTTERREP